MKLCLTAQLNMGGKPLLIEFQLDKRTIVR